MITDEMLTEQAKQAALQINAMLPEPEDCEHDYSPEFRRRMAKTIRRVRHPVLYDIGRAAACLLLVLLLSAESAVLLSPQIRAEAAQWVSVGIETVQSLLP